MYLSLGFTSVKFRSLKTLQHTFSPKIPLVVAGKLYHKDTINCTMADFLGQGKMQREICSWRDGTRTNPKHTETPNTHTQRPTPKKPQANSPLQMERELFRRLFVGNRVKSVVQAPGLAHNWLLPELNRRAGEGGARQAWGQAGVTRSLSTKGVEGFRLEWL